MEKDLKEVISNADIKDIEYILEELATKQKLDIKDSNPTHIEETLSQDDVETIKLALDTLIDKDEDFKEQLQQIVDEYQDTRDLDVSSINLSIIAITYIVNNLIKAKYPNREIIKDGDKIKEIDRGYNSISDVIKSLKSIIKEE